MALHFYLIKFPQELLSSFSLSHPSPHEGRKVEGSLVAGRGPLTGHKVKEGIEMGQSPGCLSIGCEISSLISAWSPCQDPRATWTGFSRKGSPSMIEWLE